MKTKFTLIAVLVISLSGTCNMAFAKEQKTQDKTVTTVAMKAENTVAVKGIVKQTQSGLSLYDGQQTYILKGNMPLVGMIGKIVQVDGSIQKTEKDSILIVKQIIETN